MGSDYVLWGYATHVEGIVRKYSCEMVLFKLKNVSLCNP